MEDEIIHNRNLKTFRYLKDGRENYLSYEIKGDSLDLTHTFVDPGCRGQGIAGALVSTALRFAGENGYKVIPSCSYVEIFIKRHEKWKYLVS